MRNHPSHPREGGGSCSMVHTRLLVASRSEVNRASCGQTAKADDDGTCAFSELCSSHERRSSNALRLPWALDDSAASMPALENFYPCVSRPTLFHTISSLPTFNHMRGILACAGIEAAITATCPEMCTALCTASSSEETAVACYWGLYISRFWCALQLERRRIHSSNRERVPCIPWHHC